MTTDPEPGPTRPNTPDTTGGSLSRASLQADLTVAIKARDELRAATLRMALTAISNEEVAGKVARTLSSEEVVLVLGKEAKRRREAAEAFDAADRPELAARERAELGVLEGYLPAALAPQELAEIVTAAVAEAAASGQEGMRAMGSVMKLVTPRVAGRADGAAVAALVRSALSG